MDARSSNLALWQYTMGQQACLNRAAAGTMAGCAWVTGRTEVRTGCSVGVGGVIPGPDQKPQEESRPPTDYRRLRARQDRSLFLAVIAFLLIVGGGLILLLYGRGGLFTGLACLLPGVGLMILLWLILSAIEVWANR